MRLKSGFHPRRPDDFGDFGDHLGQGTTRIDHAVTVRGQPRPAPGRRRAPCHEKPGRASRTVLHRSHHHPAAWCFATGRGADRHPARSSNQAIIRRQNARANPGSSLPAIHGLRPDTPRMIQRTDHRRPAGQPSEPARSNASHAAHAPPSSTAARPRHPSQGPAPTGASRATPKLPVCRRARALRSRRGKLLTETREQRFYRCLRHLRERQRKTGGAVLQGAQRRRRGGFPEPPRPPACLRRR